MDSGRRLLHGGTRTVRCAQSSARRDGKAESHALCRGLPRLRGEVELARRLAPLQGPMRPDAVAGRQVRTDAALRFGDQALGLRVRALVFRSLTEPPDERLVEPALVAARSDARRAIEKRHRRRLAPEPSRLARVTGLGHTVTGERCSERRRARVRRERVRGAPDARLATRQARDAHQAPESSGRVGVDPVRIQLRSGRGPARQLRPREPAGPGEEVKP